MPATAKPEKRPAEKPHSDEPAKGGTKPASGDVHPSGDSPKPHGDPLRHVIEEQNDKK
jgi:hypothetical protein